MKRANRGLTLIEVLIAVVIMALLFLAIFLLIFQGGSTYADATRHITLQRNGREVLERIAQELRYAQPVPVHVEAPGVGYLNYRKSIGFDGTDTIWSEPITIAVQENQEGAADANNNGLQDDHRLVRTSSDLVGGVLTSQTAVLCDYVKSFQVKYVSGVTSGDVANGVHRYELSLTLAVKDADQKEMSTTVTTTVVLRKQLLP